ncbi:MAG: anthranilate synthase component I family protein [Rickettsiales bacterium]
MRFHDEIPWIDPQALFAWARRFGKVRTLLHSSACDERDGGYSWLACDPVACVSSLREFAEGAFLSRHADNVAANNWFGYVGYEALTLVEPSVPTRKRAFIRAPDLWLCRFRRVYIFDALKKTVSLWTEKDARPPYFPSFSMGTPDFPPIPRLKEFRTLMPRVAYLRRVETILEHIRAGDIFQANLTRKHVGAFASAPNPNAVYARLASAAPGQYAAHLATPFAHILSSSPECFMRVDSQGRMRASPIKGTAPRSRGREQDLANKKALEESEKDRAENVMIVDLYRNDLSRSCVPGSVQVPELCAVRSYPSVHHMTSTVTGQKRSDVSTLQAVMAAFPPGSMTGAPKHRAMNVCLANESWRRGVYSGIIGRFGGDGAADFSVVIRTLILRGKFMECQTGGGIVADSDPLYELRETAIKLRGIATALGEEKRMERALLK